jgi:cytochrome P450
LWYLLALHPRVFDKVAAEARGLALDEAPDWRMLGSMQWIPWAILETLRLYPPGWLYTRRAIAEDRFGQYSVPAGTDVFICSWLLHRHPAFWDRPDQFLPERFAPQQQSRRHGYCYIPFSAGPRHCIGESFAMAEMMIHLAILASRLRPQTVEPREVEAVAEVNLRPLQPLFVTFAVDD